MADTPKIEMSDEEMMKNCDKCKKFQALLMSSMEALAEMCKEMHDYIQEHEEAQDEIINNLRGSGQLTDTTTHYIGAMNILNTCAKVGREMSKAMALITDPKMGNLMQLLDMLVSKVKDGEPTSDFEDIQGFTKPPIFEN